MTGRTSTEPNRAPGILAAHSIASSRLSHSSRVEAAELLLRLCERPVGEHALAVAHAHGCGRGGGLKALASEDAVRGLLAEAP